MLLSAFCIHCEIKEGGNPSFSVLVYFVFAFMCAFGVETAYSQTQLEKFQDDRTAYRDVTGKACLGDSEAVQSLLNDAFKGKNAVALNNIAWLGEHLDRCPKSTLEYDAQIVSDGYRMSHNRGYPIGSYYYGRMLIEGRHDSKQDVATAIEILEKSLKGGYARAGAFLADLYLLGEHSIEIDLNKSEDFLNSAKSAGLDADKVARIRTNLLVARQEALTLQTNSRGQADTGGGISEAEIHKAIELEQTKLTLAEESDDSAGILRSREQLRQLTALRFQVIQKGASQSINEKGQTSAGTKIQRRAMTKQISGTLKQDDPQSNANAR